MIGFVTPPPHRCTAPAVAGLTEQVAARRVRLAGCRLRLRGARLKQATVQTVAAQTPGAGTSATVVTLRLNPDCVGPAAAGPPHDQGSRPGPTELITGLFIEGGPVQMYSTPGCRQPPGTPVAGTIDVLDRASRQVVRTRTIHRGRYVTFRLAPGRYLVQGSLGHDNATIASPVTIRAGFTTRQYTVEPVP
jgi:hypothetical protein